MFTSVFSRRNSSQANEPDDATTFTATSIKSDDTPKSILRRQGSERNTFRSVSWSSTYETLELDSLDQNEGLEGADSTWTYGDATRTYDTNTYDSADSRTAFETREEESLSNRNANTFETRETSQTLGHAATASTNDSLESVEAYESVINSGSDEDTFNNATIKPEEGVEQTLEANQVDTPEQEREALPVADNNENLELRNIACAASNVTEASELTDKYGLSEKEAKRGMRLLAADSCVSDAESVFGDKYHGLEDESIGEEKAIEKNQAPTEIEEAQASATPEKDAAVEVQEQSLLSPIGLDAANIFVPGEAEPIGDELIQEAPSVDTLTVGSLSEEQFSQSFEGNAENTSLKANSDEGSLASLKKKENGYEDIFQDQHAADKSLGHIGLILPFLSRLRCGAFTEDTAVLDGVDSREWTQNASAEEEAGGSEELQEVAGDIPENEYVVTTEEEVVQAYEEKSEEWNQPDNEYDVAEYQDGDDGNITGEDTSTQSPIRDNASSMDGSTPSEYKSLKSDQSESGESPRVGGVISFSVAEDDSIPSNDSEDKLEAQQKNGKKGFNPLVSLRKRVSRAASSIIGKNNRSRKISSEKQRKSSAMTPRMYEADTLHDRVYHNNVPASQARISTELILDDLKIVENTAKIMYQDRFNSTPSLLNPDDADVSASKSKRKEINVDINSQRSRSTAESALSPMFRDYFSNGNN